MTEPIATRPDASTWEEPRGPHLPDVLTRVPLLVWPFVALSVATAWALTQQDGLNGLTAVETARWAISEAPSVLAPLVGAALFLRHRDALRALPMLAFGAVLLAVGAVLELVDPWLTEVLREIAPPAADALVVEAPLALWYGVLRPLVPVFAVLYLARGLASARRFDDVGSSRWLVVPAGLAIAGIVVYHAWSFATLAGSDQSEYVAVSVAAAAIGVGEILAWLHLASTALGGRRAGEDPARGWSFGAAGGLVYLAATFVFYALFIATTLLGGLWEAGTFAGDTARVIVFLASLGRAVAWLLLLTAFLVGLPAVGEVDDPADDDEDEFDFDLAESPGSIAAADDA